MDMGSRINEMKNRINQILLKADNNKNDTYSILGILINNEHIFFNIFEELFGALVLKYQTQRNDTSKQPLIRLTNLISSICKINSSIKLHRAY